MAASPFVNRRRRPVFLWFAMAAGVWLASTSGLRAETVTLVTLGDSLAAGYGLEQEDAFPIRLEEALKARGHDVSVLNAGVSGDTSAGGLARLDWAVGPEADGVIVELGANDALRGIAPEETRENLDTLISNLRDRGIPLLLAGMLAPRNMGEDYAAEFDAIYPDLARKHDVVFYPFFLDGVATEPDLNQSDGIHPNPAGVGVIVEGILPAVEDLLDDISGEAIGD